MKQDPNIQWVELAANALGSIMDELVLVGGCAVGLLITDPAAPPIRQTIDVDLITEVAPLVNYYELCVRLRERGFKECHDVICRWQFGELKIDVMPKEESVLGFTSEWYGEAARTALFHTLPNGKKIRVIAPRVLIATKLESFAARGQGDYLHHDLEDIINLIDGRPSLVDEIINTSDEIKDYVRGELLALIARPEFDEKLIWLVRDQGNRIDIVRERLRKICGL